MGPAVVRRPRCCKEDLLCPRRALAEATLAEAAVSSGCHRKAPDSLCGKRQSLEMSVQFRLGAILDKMDNRDKDYRYMACSDLSNELAKETFACSADEEQKMCESLMRLLGDSASEVQGVAVKW